MSDGGNSTQDGANIRGQSPLQNTDSRMATRKMSDGGNFSDGGKMSDAESWGRFPLHNYSKSQLF